MVLVSHHFKEKDTTPFRSLAIITSRRVKPTNTKNENFEKQAYENCLVTLTFKGSYFYLLSEPLDPSSSISSFLLSIFFLSL